MKSACVFAERTLIVRIGYNKFTCSLSEIESHLSVLSKNCIVLIYRRVHVSHLMQLIMQAFL